jgi:hypothetical protein
MGRSAAWRTSNPHAIDVGKTEGPIGRCEAGVTICAANAPTPSCAGQLAGATRSARWQAKQQLKAYRLKAQIALLKWLRSEVGLGQPLNEATLLQWRAHWISSAEGRQSGYELVVHLADYNRAAKRELRPAAEVHDGAQAAIGNVLAEVMRRDSDGDWEDEVLDRMLAAWAERVVREAQSDHG